VLNAERVAAQLSALRLGVKDVVLSSWALDEAYEKALEAFSGERDRCVQAELQAKRVWRAGIADIVRALIASLAIAFVLMVTADITKAVLDNAENTAVIAAAHRVETE
jgi:hypothetical protein